MRDDETEKKVQDQDGETAEALPVVPLPIGGFAAVGGTVGGSAGSLNQPANAVAPLTGGAATFGVAPGGAADGALATAAEEALAADGRLGSARIAVLAEKGILTLTGTVASERERATARDICARLPGVQSVEERLRVEV